MNEKHIVLFGPGLDGRTNSLEMLSFYWPLFDLTPVMYPMIWKDNEPYEDKLQKLLSTIDGYVDAGHWVSGIGFSASGSHMFNAYLERADVMHKVVSVNGRLKVGIDTGYRGFTRRTHESQAFAESVRYIEKRMLDVPDEAKARMMTTYALLFDQLVPPDTTKYRGIKSYPIPWGEHISSSGLAVLVFAWPILSFLREGLDK